MKFLWDRFVVATGKTAEMNARVRELAYELVEQHGWPKKVIIGTYWLRDLKQTPTSFWLGDFGINAEVEIVKGKRLEVL